MYSRFVVFKIEFASTETIHLRDITSIRYHTLARGWGACALFRVRVCPAYTLFTMSCNIQIILGIESKRNLLTLPVGIRRVRIEPNPEARANETSLRRRYVFVTCYICRSSEPNRPVATASHFASPCTARRLL